MSDFTNDSIVMVILACTGLIMATITVVATGLHSDATLTGLSLLFFASGVLSAYVAYSEYKGDSA